MFETNKFRTVETWNNWHSSKMDTSSAHFHYCASQCAEVKLTMCIRLWNSSKRVSMSSMVSSTGASWKIQIDLHPGFIYYTRFEVLMTMNIQSMVVIQDVMTCSLTEGCHYIIWDLRFSWWWIFRVWWSSEMMICSLTKGCHCFRGTQLAWRWRHFTPLKHWYLPTKLHIVMC